MTVLNQISLWILPVLILLIVVAAIIKKVPVYESFVEGGKDGFQIAVDLIPYLLGMLMAIHIFRASGAMDMMTHLFVPFVQLIHVPKEVIPLALMRPISGTGSLALMTDLIKTYGPDSYIGRLASTMQGATDTTFYIITVYFGAIGLKKVGDALKVGLLADFIGIAAAVVIITYFF